MHPGRALLPGPALGPAPLRRLLRAVPLRPPVPAHRVPGRRGGTGPLRPRRRAGPGPFRRRDAHGDRAPLLGLADPPSDRAAAAEFAYPVPAHALEYDLLFGAPCRFDAERTALVLDRALLDEPVVQDAEGLERFLRAAPADLLARTDFGNTTAARVRRIIGRGLPGALPGTDEVAAALSVSPQTLRRRLAAEGTSFQEVRDQLRRDHAVAALASGRVPIEELSRRLGFSEPSAFHRAFRRWTGSTPAATSRAAEHRPGVPGPRSKRAQDVGRRAPARSYGGELSRGRSPRCWSG
ncbi:helix-turn-helix domain-containing protein [Streptacidiphilus monticola]